MSKLIIKAGSELFPGTLRDIEVEPGMTLEECAAALEYGPGIRAQLRCSLNGADIPQVYWKHIRPKAGARVFFSVIPAGGIVDNGTIRTAGMLGSILLSTIGGTLIGGIPGAVVRIVGSFVGMLLVNAFVKPPVQAEQRTLPSIRGGSNATSVGGAIPKVYGKCRIYPPYAAQPVTEIQGDYQYVKMLFCLGYAPLKVHDIRLGDIPLGSSRGLPRLRDVQIELDTGWENTSSVKPTMLYSNDRDIEELRIDRVLRYAGDWQTSRGLEYAGDPPVRVVRPPTFNENVVVFKTQQNATAISFDIEFPEGLYRADSDGTRYGWRVNFAARYRLIGGNRSTWYDIPPVWMDDYRQRNLNLFSDSELYRLINLVIDLLNIVVPILEAIASINRIATQALVNWMKRHVPVIEEMLQARIDAGDADATLTDVIGDLNPLLARLLVVVDDATTVIEEAGDTLGAFQQNLEALIIVMDFIDSWTMYRDALDHGYSLTEIADLTPFWRLLVGHRNLGQLFGTPDPGEFFLASDDNTDTTLRKTLQWPVLPGQYEVQVRRISEDAGDGDNVSDECFLTVARSVTEAQPIREAVRRKLALLAVRIKVTDALNGTIDRINCLVESPLPWHDGTSWQPAALVDGDGRNVSRNPAWQVADVWRGPAKRNPKTDAQFDVSRFRTIAQIAADGKWYFDGVFDQIRTAEDVSNDIWRSVKASRLLRDGKESAAYDHAVDTITDILQPRESREAKHSIPNLRPPECIRAKYVNADNDYQTDTMYVYADGFGDPTIPVQQLVWFDGGQQDFIFPYDVSQIDSILDTTTGAQVAPLDYTVTKFNSGGVLHTRVRYRVADLWPEGEQRFRIDHRFTPTAPEIVEDVDFGMCADTPDTTSANHTGLIYRLSRYMLAVPRLRPSIHERLVAWNRIRWERGDRIEVQDPVTMWGQNSAEVQEASYTTAGDLEWVRIDDFFTMATGVAYRVKIRTRDGVVHTADVANAPGTTDEIEFDPPLDLDGSTVANGDILVFGEQFLETRSCIVKEIAPEDDLTARVLLIEHAPAIHDSDREIIPEFTTGATTPADPVLIRPPAPRVLERITDERALYTAPDGSTQQGIILVVDFGGQNAAARNIAAVRVDYKPYNEDVDGPLSRDQVRLEGDVYPVDSSRAQTILGEGWTRAPLFTENLNELRIGPVDERLLYNVRLQSITGTGINSDFAVYRAIPIVGKRNPPPDVLRARIDGGTFLRWDYPNPPRDMAGFYVRTVYGVNVDWEAAIAAHPGILRTGELNVSEFRTGTRTFLIRAVDTSGNLSVNAARVIIGLGDALVQNILLKVDEKDLGWVGTRTNMEEDGTPPDNYLVVTAADSGAIKPLAWNLVRGGAWELAGDAKAWKNNYHRGIYTQTYSFYESTIPLDLNLILDVDFDPADSDPRNTAWVAEYRLSNPPLLVEDEDTGEFQNLIPDGGVGDFIPADYDWQPLRERLQIREPTDLQVRVRFPQQNRQGRIKRMELIAYVDDIIEYVDGVELAGTGTNTIYPTKTFRQIVSVQVTLEDAATPYHEAEFVKREIVNSGPGAPYVILTAYKNPNHQVAGICDVTIQGY